MIVVVMGVSGCGKSTVGQALAGSLGWKFLDADDFHPPTNVAKMAAGTPLTDDDRWPWLDCVACELRAVNAAGSHAVLACSALRQAYRDRLAAAGDVRFVHLAGDMPTIAKRIETRRHRYMPTSLLASQFAALEPPADAIVIDVRIPLAEKVDEIRAALDDTKAAPR
jgi:carbohydrate kinase (thermoresistant glucokinase family)